MKMVPVKQKILRSGARNRPSTRGNSGIYGHLNEKKFLCKHETGNYQRTAGAANHAAWLYRETEMIVGYHFTVDHDKIYQHIPIDEGAWHAGDGVGGDGNLHSIGVETCVNMFNYDRSKYEKAVNNTAWLFAKIINDHASLTFPGSVKQHFDFNGKNCPRQMRAANKWNDFLNQIEAYLGGKDMSEEIPVIQREIAVRVNEMPTNEVGYLINNRTYVRAGYIGELMDVQVTGHGSYINVHT